MKKRLAFTVFVAAALLLASVPMLLRDEGMHKSLATISREEALQYFSDQIASQGASAAYARFSRDVDPEPVDRQHVLAHVFGEALYASEGLRGIQVCDLEFIYGCIHELMGRAIAERGLGVVSAAYAACIDAPEPRPFACLHGIGHGITASVGYDEQELENALEACDSIKATFPVRACYSGVFMEYNQQSMLGTAHVRPGTPDDPYAPCSSIAERYKRHCIYEQVPWWHRVYFAGDTSEATFAALSQYCENGYETTDLKRVCFEGIGNITTPAVGYDPEAARHLCEAASSDPYVQLFCKSMAALSLAEAERDIEAAERVCQDLEGGAFAFCLGYAHNEANMMHPLEVPEL